jgi:hypothetical protein
MPLCLLDGSNGLLDRGEEPEVNLSLAADPDTGLVLAAAFPDAMGQQRTVSGRLRVGFGDLSGAFSVAWMEELLTVFESLAEQFDFLG